MCICRKIKNQSNCPDKIVNWFIGFATGVALQLNLIIAPWGGFWQLINCCRRKNLTADYVQKESIIWKLIF